ncbi:MAG: FAD-dependent oxidoreductase [Phormidesmis sp. RL_2_1]|nr:FAD-dependent oxidoreductase [Phormidesmis sp. RL_2_1]
MPTLPQALTIWGGSLEAVVWAEALSAIGVEIQLVTDSFLKDEDGDIRQLMRSQLLINGVTIAHPSSVCDSSNLHSLVLAQLTGAGQKPWPTTHCC